MATYRLGFYGFGELALPEAAGIGIFQPAPTPGGRFQLAGSRPVLTPILVAEADGLVPDGTMASGVPRLQIAPGSSFGVEGEAVGLDHCLTLLTDDTPPHWQTCELLSIGGTPVGLLAAAPLRPGVIYTVTQGIASDAGMRLRSFDRALAATAAASSREAVFCLTFGTRIDTPDGPRLIEHLCPADLVTTLGNGSQPLRWTGSRHVTAAEMLQVPDLMPVEFAAGVIGNPRPLRVSPQHRILLNDWRAQVFFGEDEVLIPAKAMVNGRTIREVLPADGVTYIHLLFDRHEIIISEGALSESFHPGETGLAALEEGQRREVELLFPGQELPRRRAAFPIVKLTEARAIRLPD